MNAALSISLFAGKNIPQAQAANIAEHVAAWTSSPDPDVKGGLVGKTSDQVLAQIFRSRSVALLSGDIVIGYAALYEVAADLSEVGTVLINPEFRGHGLARKIFEGLRDLHRFIGGSLAMTTKCHKVVHLGVEVLGMRRDSFTVLDDEEHAGVCRTATCWKPRPEKPRACAVDAHHGGNCMLCMLRRPTAAAAPS